MITEAEQQSLDIDWFFTDGDNIGFVASGGGKLPETVSKSRDNIEEIANYFRSLPVVGDAIVNPNLSKAMGGRMVDDRYLVDFIDMAKRGLYAFDKTVLNSFSETNYHLVARPTRLIKLQELPPTIANRVIQTKIHNEITEHLSTESFPPNLARE